MRIVKIYPIRKKKKSKKKKGTKHTEPFAFARFPFLEIAIAFLGGIIFEKLTRPNIPINLPTNAPPQAPRMPHVV